MKTHNSSEFRDYDKIHKNVLSKLQTIKRKLFLVGDTLQNYKKGHMTKIYNELFPINEDYRAIVYAIINRYADDSLSSTLGHKSEPYFEKEDIEPDQYTIDSLSPSEKKLL